MEKEKKTMEKENLQSRREFFRNATRATLPIFGVSIISKFNDIEDYFKDARPSSFECADAWQGGCTGICQGCKGCKGTCTGCKGYCSKECKDDCEKSCTRSCADSCEFGCDRTCSGPSRD